MNKILSVVSLCGLLIGCAQSYAFQRMSAQIKQIPLNLEVADSSTLRQKGLMHRTELCPNCGMLFCYEREKIVSMWMKNTNIALDIAFIDKNGVITEIKQLQPHDLTSVPSSQPVLYALEMNQGWFAAHQVRVGDKIQLDHNP